MADERPHSDVLLAAWNAELDPREAYTRGKVPGLDGNGGPEPAIYGILDLERRDGGPTMRAGRTLRRSWRVTARGVGRTVDEARWALSRAATALEGVQFTVDGLTTTPLAFESSDAVAPDGKRFSGSITYTYGI